MKNVQFTLVLAAMSVLTLSQIATAVTIDDFDGTGLTRVDVNQGDLTFAPTITTGGPSGDFMRMIQTGTTGDANYSHWDRPFIGAQTSITLEFDARLSGGADGLGILFLPTATYGTTSTSAGHYIGAFEEPNVLNTFAVGIDLYNGIDEISLHDGSMDAQNDPGFDLNDNAFHHFSITWTEDAAVNSSLVSVTVDSTDYYTNEQIDLDLYEFRMEIGGRTGGQTRTADMYSVSVIPEPSTMALTAFGMVALLVRRRRR